MKFTHLKNNITITSRHKSFPYDPDYGQDEEYFLDNEANNPIAEIIYGFFPNHNAEEILTIDKVKVYGHDNYSARNPYPGTGSLLMYLACKEALRRGIRKVSLLADIGSQDFYRKLGMYHEIGFHDVNPNLSGLPQYENHKIGKDWRSKFDKHFGDVRSYGNFEGEIMTVMTLAHKGAMIHWKEEEG